MANMKKLVLSALVIGLLGGCSTSGPVYSWYHPLGGEYLFAYDHIECVSELTDLGLTPGTNVDGPFFQCMQNRGYSLVEPAQQVPPYEHLGTIQ